MILSDCCSAGFTIRGFFVEYSEKGREKGVTRWWEEGVVERALWFEVREMFQWI
jgi:hypothetical protein